MYMRTVLWCSVRGDEMCRERLHILSFSGDNVCRVRQNVPLRVHMLSPATNCAGATKCAVTHTVLEWHTLLHYLELAFCVRPSSIGHPVACPDQLG